MCQAMAELKQQYRTEGEERGILFSAKKMLERGISYEQIEEKLGVSKKDIEQYEEEQ